MNKTIREQKLGSTFWGMDFSSEKYSSSIWFQLAHTAADRLVLQDGVLSWSIFNFLHNFSNGLRLTICWLCHWASMSFLKKSLRLFALWQDAWLLSLEMTCQKIYFWLMQWEKRLQYFIVHCNIAFCFLFTW